MTPTDIERNLQSLGAMLLSLKTEDKKTLKDCLLTGAEPPPRLFELLEAVKDALKVPEKQDSIQAALDADGQTFFVFTKQQHEQPGSADEYAKTQISLYKLLRDDIKDSIAAAIKDPQKRRNWHYTVEQGYILITIYDLLTFQNDYRKQLADVFHVSIADLDELKAEALKRFDIGYEEEKKDYIPGLEPTTEEHRKSIIRIHEQQRLQYNATALRLSSKLDRKASYFPNSGDAFHTLDIVKNKSLQVKWNVPAAPDGKPQRITPYDQEVEAAISNLVDQHGAQGYTYEQIYCMMNGITAESGTHISPKALEDIRKSIWKLNKTDIEVFQKSDKGEELVTHGMITDAIEKRIKTHTGQIKGGFLFSRPGLLYYIDKHYNSLLAVTRKQLNISAGYRAADGTQRKISITPLSVIIRRYLIMEIFRIRNTPSMAPTANKITYDAVIKYEADPDLVEYNPDGTIKTTPAGERILRNWTTPTEKKSLEKHRKHRRDLVLDILGHFQATGLIKGFQETTEGRAKTGVLIKVDKTPGALRGLKRADDLKRLQGGQN